MSNGGNMTDTQRAIWLAWIEADRKVSHLVSQKPELPGHVATDEERAAARDAYHTWRDDWNTALGYRDGLHAAGVLAGVPNFKD